MPYDLRKLHADIAQIKHDDAGFGTGRLVARNLVLTAAHLLRKPDGSGLVLDGWQVRLAWDRSDSGWRFRQASPVKWHDEALDLALIEIIDFQGYPIYPKLEFRVADVVENSGHAVEARGYPRTANMAAQESDVTLVSGRLTAAAPGRSFCFGIESGDAANEPHSDLQGLSGSAVLLRDWPYPTYPTAIWIYGVVQGVPDKLNGQLSVSRLAQAWNDTAFRRLLVDAGAPDQDAGDPTTASEYRFFQLVPKTPGQFQHSVLGKIVSSTLDAVPAASLKHESVQAGHSAAELYDTVAALIERLQNIGDEIVETLRAGGITSDDHHSLYGSAGRISQARILQANTKLAAIAADMRQIAGSLQDMLPETSAARQKFTAILQICASISVEQDFLLVEFGAPKDISIAADRPRFAIYRAPGRLNGVSRHDTWDGALQLPEYARLRAELEAYKRQLRGESART